MNAQAERVWLIASAKTRLVLAAELIREAIGELESAGAAGQFPTLAKTLLRNAIEFRDLVFSWASRTID